MIEKERRCCNWWNWINKNRPKFPQHFKARKKFPILFKINFDNEENSLKYAHLEEFIEGMLIGAIDV